LGGRIALSKGATLTQNCSKGRRGRGVLGRSEKGEGKSSARSRAKDNVKKKERIIPSGSLEDVEKLKQEAL